MPRGYKCLLKRFDGCADRCLKTDFMYKWGEDSIRSVAQIWIEVRNLAALTLALSFWRERMDD